MRQAIGIVKLVQIQRASLKAGARPHAYYDPTPLLEVARLRLTPGGVVGLLEDRRAIIDVHHAQHPDSKHQGGLNGISFGFTGHYQAMRGRFGAHLSDGCAGENILIETSRILGLSDLGKRLVIERDGRDVARLDNLLVAAPCVEFSRFAQNSDAPLPAEALRETLQFLNDGMRGFYTCLAAGQPDPIVQAGDRVVAEA